MLPAGQTDDFLAILLHDWTAPGFRFPQASLEDYLETFREPATLHASCEDYRGSWGGGLTAMRIFRIVTQANASVSHSWFCGARRRTANKAGPLDIWRKWAVNLIGHGLPCGHFISEETPEETAPALEAFFAVTEE